MRSPETRIHFGGHALLLHAEGVLYWPAQKTLVAADLHFEKSTFLARHGALMPPYDTQDTLERLERLVAHYQPTRLLLLGDSFHDRAAWHRLDESLRMRILRLAGTVLECVWVEGNHDVALQAHPLGLLRTAASFDGLHFAHDSNHALRPLIIGHYHPKAQVALAGGSARGKCFIHSDTLLVMPSFGSYTGGLNITHEALQALFTGQQTHVHLLYGNALYTLPQRQ